MVNLKESYSSMQKHFNTADHLVFVTYPLVKDVKLLLQVVDSLNKSMIAMVDVLLLYEREYKRIGPYSDNMDHKLDVFRDYCMPRYGINKEFLGLFKEINGLVRAHKSSPVEFKRDDKYVICGSDYKMTTITLEQVKGYVLNAKPFILKASNIVRKDAIRRRL